MRKPAGKQSRRRTLHCGAARFLGTCGLALASSFGLFVERALAQNPPLVIEGGTLIDGRGGPPRPDTVIVIEGNKITAVGENDGVLRPPGARRIPASGKYILPGLIDMHVHWDEWMPELFLAHGVTAAVDLNPGPWQLQQKEALAQGRLLGPRLFLSTPALSGRLVWDLRRTEPLEDAETARKLIRAAGPGRSDYALGKAYTELTPEELQAIVEESHQAGRLVIAHLGSLDARQAAEMGVEGLAHASGIALATIRDPVKVEELRAFERLGMAVYFPLYLIYHSYMDPAMTDELIGLLVRKNVRIEPDLITTARWASKQWGRFSAEYARLLADPNLRYVPEERHDRIFYDASTRLNPPERAQMQRGYENLKNFLRKFAEAGGTVLAGCDTPSFVPPGLCLHQELELLVEAGLTPLQAIQAATRNNAEFLQASELGVVEPGKLADLILLRENPLADIRNTRTIQVVIQGGKVMDTRYHPDFVNPLPRPPQPPTNTINPVAFVRALFPMEAKEPGKDVEVIVAGSNFVEGSVVEFEGAALPTHPVRTSRIYETAFNPVYTELTARIAGRLVSKVGAYKVVVRNPKPQGGVSNAVDFFVAPALAGR